MPNTLAYLMLMIWPLVCLALFRRLSLERAMIWSIVGGYLVLPPLAEFDFPLVPGMDKFSIPNVSAFVICVFVLQKKVAIWPQSAIARMLTALFVLSVIPTVATNNDPLLFRVMPNSDSIPFIVGQLPALTARDLFSVLVGQIIVLLPFLMARQYLSTPEGLRDLVLALAVAGLVYAIPALIEIRLSPQINIWVYGFFQHSFTQMMRDGGFRPIVFLPHALWLALFMVMALVSAATLARNTTGNSRKRWLMATGFLGVVLLLSKSLASLAYGLAFTPAILLLSRKMLIRLSMLLALIAVSYPMLRNADVIPLERILEQARAIDPKREQSLAYRFNNENRLLERADEKPLFGWGGWGRNLLRNPESGKIETIPDGRWIIVFGSSGWVGYIAEMGMLAFPLLLLGWRMRKLPNERISPFVAPIAVILAATMADMLLNATLIPITWMCAGAILGYAERLKQPRQHEAREPAFGGGPVIGQTGETNGPQQGQRPLM